MENQKNQVENQVDFNLSNFDKETNQNIVCNIYKEQFDLINELPEEERLKVLYLAVLNAFMENEEIIKINQVENQVDYTYISNSIYISLSNYSKKLIKLLYKTINCKKYKNWGGKRKSAGRKKKEENKIISIIPTKKEIEDYCTAISRKIDVEEFMAYYNASNWKDKNGLPVNWEQKVLRFAQNYKPKVEEKPYVYNPCL